MVCFLFCWIHWFQRLYQQFFNCILLFMLLELSQFFPLCSPPHSIPDSLRQSPHHGSCPWAMCISSLAIPFPMLYFTSPWLFCNYLFALLNPLTSSPISPYPLPSGNHQNVLYIHDSVFALPVCLVCFSDSIVDIVFNCIYCHFIVHSFDLLFLK